MQVMALTEGVQIACFHMFSMSQGLNVTRGVSGEGATLKPESAKRIPPRIPYL